MFHIFTKFIIHWFFFVIFSFCCWLYFLTFKSFIYLFISTQNKNIVCRKAASEIVSITDNDRYVIFILSLTHTHNYTRLSRLYRWILLLDVYWACVLSLSLSCIIHSQWSTVLVISNDWWVMSMQKVMLFGLHIDRFWLRYFVWIIWH